MAIGLNLKLSKLFFSLRILSSCAELRKVQERQKSIGLVQLHQQFPPVLRPKSDTNMITLRSHTVKLSSSLINLDGALGKRISSMEILYPWAVSGNLI